MPTVTIPKSNAEVFAQYYPHVKYLVARTGIRSDYVEDYAMNLMEKFIKNGVLEDYDPSRTSEVDGVARTANFKTFLSGFVTSYLRHFIERDRINAMRSSISTDMTIRQDENKDTLLIDHLTWTEPDTESVEVDELVERVRAIFAVNHRKALFMEMVLLQVEEHGKVDVKELAEMFDVTRSSIHNWLKKLKEAFEECR